MAVRVFKKIQILWRKNKMINVYDTSTCVVIHQFLIFPEFS